jgi:transposase
MAYSTLMAGPERRRRWSEHQKQAVLSAAFSPGASVADVARQADICTSLIYRWRRAHLSAQASPGFVPAVIVETPASSSASVAIGGPAMVVELSCGARVSIASTAPAALVTAALRALR